MLQKYVVRVEPIAARVFGSVVVQPAVDPREISEHSVHSLHFFIVRQRYEGKFIRAFAGCRSNPFLRKKDSDPFITVNTYQYALISTNMHQYVPTQHQYITIHTKSYQIVPILTNTHQYSPILTNTHQYSSILTNTCQYIPRHLKFAPLDGKQDAALPRFTTRCPEYYCK